MFGIIKNLNFEGSKPQYFRELKKFSTKIRLFSLQANINGTDAI